MTKEKQPSTLMSRRTFVNTVATAAGVTIVPRHVLGGTGYQAPSDPDEGGDRTVDPG